MNPKKISKIYEAMSIEERAALASNAIMRGDSDTYSQIAYTVPRLTYKQRDLRFAQGISNRCDLVLAWSSEHWKTLAIYLMNQKLAIEALTKGNSEEHKELLLSAGELLSKLVALEAVLRALAVDAGVDTSELFDSELLITFGDKATLDSLSEQERRHYDELYIIFASAKNVD